jgi:hypothetical protein
MTFCHIPSSKFVQKRNTAQICRSYVFDWKKEDDEQRLLLSFFFPSCLLLLSFFFLSFLLSTGLKNCRDERLRVDGEDDFGAICRSTRTKHKEK